MPALETSIKRERAFKRALGLLRVGEYRLAKRELAWLKLTTRNAKQEHLWYAAALLHDAGAYADASRFVRARLGFFDDGVPTPKLATLWRIAYPNAYSPLIEQVSQKAGVPATLVRAVAREESGFNPGAISRTRAYGLVQLMRPTAREYARRLRLPSDPGSLRVPEINLRIGAQFLRDLWSRYPGNPAVLPSAYNAGPGATDRWLKARPELALDAWIEEIPYLETRRYTKRVLESWGVYRWLEAGEPRRLSFRLPSPR